MSHAAAGLLGTIPVLCMSALAPLGPVVAASIGPRLAAAACVGLIAVFGLLRAFLPDAATVLLATVGVGAGMAVIGPVLPAVVRARLPRHPAAGTGAYVSGQAVGAAVAAAAAVPLADALGGWRPTFFVVSAVALVSLALWLVLMPADHGHVRAAPRRPRLPWRRPSAWLLGVIFGTQSVLFYGSITWLAAAYVERGWAPADAGALVALLTGVGLVSSLAIPLIGDRLGTRRSQLTLAALLSLIGVAVIIATPGVAPGSPIAYVAVTVFGLGLGAYFPLALTLPVDVAAEPADVAPLSALMLLVGYLLAATAPVLLGVVRDATGSFDLDLWLMLGVTIVMLPLSLSLHAGRLRRMGGADD